MVFRKNNNTSYSSNRKFLEIQKLDRGKFDPEKMYLL